MILNGKVILDRWDKDGLCACIFSLTHPFFVRCVLYVKAGSISISSIGTISFSKFISSWCPWMLWKKRTNRKVFVKIFPTRPNIIRLHNLITCTSIYIKGGGFFTPPVFGLNADFECKRSEKIERRLKRGYGASKVKTFHLLPRKVRSSFMIKTCILVSFWRSPRK